jgi:proprotein convertase subtilisin/kexin type 5
LYNSTCIAGCPTGTYNSTKICQNCLSSCQSCSNGTSCDTCRAGNYLINGLCQTSCPNGYFQDFSTGTCGNCDAICSTCSNSSISCTSCPSPTLYFNNTCVAICPSNYFPVNGFCLTCTNCINCSSATTCVQCISGYYLFIGVCYTNCPPTGIADPLSMTCTQCDSSCLTCSGITANCTSCKGGNYLYKSVCFSTCPTGLISNGITNTCDVSTIGSIVYFPCSITFFIWLIIVFYSKYQN